MPDRKRSGERVRTNAVAEARERGRRDYGHCSLPSHMNCPVHGRCDRTRSGKENGHPASISTPIRHPVAEYDTD